MSESNHQTYHVSCFSSLHAVFCSPGIVLFLWQFGWHSLLALDSCLSNISSEIAETKKVLKFNHIHSEQPIIINIPFLCTQSHMDQFLGGGVKNFYIYEKYGFRIPD